MILPRLAFSRHLESSAMRRTVGNYLGIVLGIQLLVIAFGAGLLAIQIGLAADSKPVRAENVDALVPISLDGVWTWLIAGLVLNSLFAVLVFILMLRRSEHAIRQSQLAVEAADRVLESILNSIAEGVVVADLEGRFLHFNQTAAEILGIGGTDRGVEG